MLRCNVAGKVLTPTLLKLGDEACMTSEPFAEFVGKIEAIAPEQTVWVLMDIVGRHPEPRVRRL